MTCCASIGYHITGEGVVYQLFVCTLHFRLDECGFLLYTCIAMLLNGSCVMPIKFVGGSALSTRRRIDKNYLLLPYGVLWSLTETIAPASPLSQSLPSTDRKDDRLPGQSNGLSSRYDYQELRLLAGVA